MITFTGIVGIILLAAVVSTVVLMLGCLFGNLLCDFYQRRKR